MSTESAPAADPDDATAESKESNGKKEIGRRTLSLTPLSPSSTSTSSSPTPLSRPIVKESSDSSVEVRAKNSRSWDEQDTSCSQDTDSIANIEDHDSCNHKNNEESPRNSFRGTGSHTESTEQEDNQTEDVYETVLIGTHDETIAVVTPSFLNNDAILQSLCSTLYGGNRSRVWNSTDMSDSEPSEQTMSEQIHEENQLQDPTVALFFKFFEFAQAERLKEKRTFPYFILGLFLNLSDVRFDLKWAQDAAHRRQMGKPYVAWADYSAKERRLPWFTWLLMYLCTMAMVWTFCENDWKMEPLKTNPLIGPDINILLQNGAMKGRILIEDDKWWLLMTTIFLHGGLAHLLLNCAMLWVLCRRFERNHGWLRTALLFVLSGTFGNMVSALLQPSLVAVGASGGICGLIGACVGDIVLNSRFFFLVLEERAQKETLKLERKKNRKKMKQERDGERRSVKETPSANENSARDLIVGTCDSVKIQYRRRRVRLWCYASLVLDLSFNFLLGLLPFVDNFAHLGGFVFGFFLSLSFLPHISPSSIDYSKKQQRTNFGRSLHRLRIFALRCGGGLSAFFLAFVGIALLRRSDGTNNPCPNCRYVSCIALPRPWKPNDSRNWWTCDSCDRVRGEAFWDRSAHDQQEIIDAVEIFCPLGNTIQVNIADEGYKELDQAIGALSNLCRAYCE